MKKPTRKTPPGDPNARRLLRRRYELIDRSTPGRRLLEFPEMKGRRVEKIEFLSTAEYHAITIFFENQSALNLAIDLGFEVHAELESDRPGEPQITKRWPPIRSQR